MLRSTLAILVLNVACQGPADDSGAPQRPREIPWSGALPSLADDIGETRGLVPRRAIIHLHSPWSHDACDGDGLPGGEPAPDCLNDLRQALCDTSVDVAFLTDHPAHAAAQEWDRLLLAREGDTPLVAAGDVVGNVIHCDDGHQVAWLPGNEDELMPVALDRHVPGDAEARDALYNRADAEALAAMEQAGAFVLMAHTEGRDPAHLQAMQDVGLGGVEIFNLHAMFAPDIRPDDLGLDPFSWIAEIVPFTDPEGTGEPDLLFLGVLQEQQPSLDRWEALLARGPMVGTAGTDAHQNVMPIALRDGERGDSYRRMFRWFGNVLLTGPPHDAPAAEAALRAGRLYVAFHALGTPSGFDLHLRAPDGTVHEMGSEAPEGTLVVRCPELSPSSPRGLDEPDILPTVFHDGQPMATTCGEIPTEGPGTYRVRIAMVPHHLRPFLGDDPEPWLISYPWVLSNAIRVR